MKLVLHHPDIQCNFSVKFHRICVPLSWEKSVVGLKFMSGASTDASDRSIVCELLRRDGGTRRSRLSGAGFTNKSASILIHF